MFAMNQNSHFNGILAPSIRQAFSAALIAGLILVFTSSIGLAQDNRGRDRRRQPDAESLKNYIKGKNRDSLGIFQRSSLNAGLVRKNIVNN